MNISVKSDIDACMTEQLAYCFCVETVLNANGGISVAKQMKIDVAYSALFQNGFKSVLNGSRFCWLVRSR